MLSYKYSFFCERNHDLKSSRSQRNKEIMEYLNLKSSKSVPEACYLQISHEDVQR